MNDARMKICSKKIKKAMQRFNSFSKNTRVHSDITFGYNSCEAHPHNYMYRVVKIGR